MQIEKPLSSWFASIVASHQSTVRLPTLPRRPQSNRRGRPKAGHLNYYASLD
jgi:hypothetical protein